MPRNPDGTFSRVINWTEEQENVATYTGAKMDSDANDLAQGITDSLDIFGTNSMKANLSMGSNRISYISRALAPDDATNRKEVRQACSLYTPPIELIDDGYDVSNLTIKLKNAGGDTYLAEKPVNGFRFLFNCRMSYTQDDIKRFKGFEKITISLNGGRWVFEGNVQRGPYDEEKNSLPSFKFNIVYHIEMLQYAQSGGYVFRLFDTIPDGRLSYIQRDLIKDTFPAGYETPDMWASTVPDLAGGLLKPIYKTPIDMKIDHWE